MPNTSVSNDKRRSPRPTIYPYPSFDSARDAWVLHQALTKSENGLKVLIRDCLKLKPFKTRCSPLVAETPANAFIINILAKRTVTQRQEIAKSYLNSYGKNLMDDLKKNHSKNFMNMLEGAMKATAEMKAIALRKAILNIETTEHVLMQILAVASNEEIHKIKEAYQIIFDRDLENDVAHETSGDFQRIMRLLLKAERNEDPIVDQARVINDVFMIFKMGDKFYGTEDRVITKILVMRSFPHIKCIASYYYRQHGNIIGRIVTLNTFKDYFETLSTIVKYAEDPVSVYANWIHKSLNEEELDHNDLIRLILSRTETDLEDIKEVYKEIDGKTLEEDIEKEISGDCRNLILALVKGNRDEVLTH